MSQGHRKRFCYSTTVLTPRGAFWFSQLYGLAPLGMPLAWTWVTGPHNGHLCHPPETTLCGCVLWVKFRRKILSSDILSDGSHHWWKGGKTKLHSLTFLESLSLIGKFGSLFHASFPDEVACGWIYTIRLPPTTPASGSLNWQFHFSGGSLTECKTGSPVLVTSMGLVPVPWL